MATIDLGGALPDRRTRKTSELLARDLATYIVDKQLPEGTRLPTEKEMLESLGVGRTTLREALRLLETRGVISIRAGRQGGPVVRRPRPDDLGEALTLMLQFESAPLSDVLNARVAIEPAVARLAAANATEEQIATLRATITSMREGPDDQQAFLEQNQIFHSGVAEASGSVILRLFSDSLKSIADGRHIADIKYGPRRRGAIANAHERILEAMERRDGDAAATAMEEHLIEAGRYWRSTYGHAFDSTVTWVR